MESAATSTMFKRSVKKYGFRYVVLLNDGDSSVYNDIIALNDGSGPYGADHPVVNEDCVNHVSKRMKNGLDGVIQSFKAKKTPIDGKGRLTQERVRAIQNYYGRAIKDHKHDLDGMYEACWAVFFHYIDDDQPRHTHCAKGEGSWCWYNRQLHDGIESPVRGEHSTPLPKRVCEAILPVFQRLTNKALLRRCLRGATQNVNESLNQVIWTRAPKVRFAGVETIRHAAARAVLEWNKGSQSLLDVMADADMSPGYHSRKKCVKRDNELKRQSRLQATERFKKIRKVKELEKLRKSSAAKRDKKSYHPGQF